MTINISWGKPDYTKPPWKFWGARIIGRVKWLFGEPKKVIGINGNYTYPNLEYKEKNVFIYTTFRLQSFQIKQQLYKQNHFIYRRIMFLKLLIIFGSFFDFSRNLIIFNPTIMDP